ncbi:hypothetical protein GYMLUDRAFT_253378 [Collybiopsis luxurians FD-317 M1]|uniref:Hydrophobin n=1 Tax=Collybiopsis luxurians FD-317 M1 TaxID=944289 RepID=A0A0D0BKM6_9AGAR|nr:hypothetical protein GYMLUDRAFT_253378 [Collybiopsis luxurians FD-317 M1]
MLFKFATISSVVVALLLNTLTVGAVPQHGPAGQACSGAGDESCPNDQLCCHNTGASV